MTKGGVAVYFLDISQHLGSLSVVGSPMEKEVAVYFPVLSRLAECVRGYFASASSRI